VRRFSAILAALVIWVQASGSAAPRAPVAAPGAPWTVVLAAAASVSEKHAAAELAKFLPRATGREAVIVGEDAPAAGLPGRIFVGFGAAAEKVLAKVRPVTPAGFGDESCLLLSSSNGAGEPADVVIAGGRRRGTLYGVYTFLDRLGVRWFTPRLTRFPAAPVDTLPGFDEVVAPAFLYRDVHIREAWDKDWAARNRVNSAHAQLDAARGGKLEVLGVHTLEKLVPPELYAAHPEYFPLIGGRRVSGYVQRCLSNPEVVVAAAAALDQWMAENPEQSYFSVSQNDTEQLCECPACRTVVEREGAPSGLYLEFVNALAQRVEAAHPGKFLCTMAYRFTEKPPLTVRPRANVIVQMCPIYICLAHPLNECGEDAGARHFGDLVGWAQTNSEEFLRHLEGWSKLTDRLFFWHYSTNFQHLLTPFPDFRQTAVNLQLYHQHGGRGVFFQGSCDDPGGSDSDLRAWVLARLLWNPALELEPLVNEWLQGVYGPAWKPMRRLYELVQERAADPAAHLHLYDPVIASRWPAPVLEEMRRVVEEALALAAGDQEAMYYISKNSLPVHYLRYLLGSGRLEVRDGLYQPAGGRAGKADGEALLALAGKFGMKVLRENAYDVQFTTLLRQRLETFPVAVLENASLRLEIVPVLGGRIVSLVHKPTGVNLLLPADPDDNLYPACGGYEESTARTWGSTGFANVYTVAAGASGSSLTLESAPSRGLQFTRTIKLNAEDAVVTVSSTVRNVHPKQRPLSARLVARLNLRSDPALPEVQARDAAGTPTLPAASETQGDAERGARRYDGGNLPAGEWSLAGLPGGLSLAQQFTPGQVENCRLTHDLTERRIVMEIAGPTATLAPGEQLSLTQAWTITVQPQKDKD
jgi:hypothetical protein